MPSSVSGGLGRFGEPGQGAPLAQVGLGLAEFCLELGVVPELGVESECPIEVVLSRDRPAGSGRHAIGLAASAKTPVVNPRPRSSR